MDITRTSLSQRGRIRVLCFAIAGILVLGGFTASGWNKAKNLERFLEYSYQRSFIELVTRVQSVDTTLQKSLYATSPTLMSQLAGDVSRDASAAQAVMGQLPFTTGTIENTAVFLTRVSDYASTLGRKAAAGQAMEQEEMEALRSLSGTARNLAAQLSELQAIVNEQQLRVGSIAQAEAEAGEQGGEGQGGSYSAFTDSFRNMENSFEDLPTLIYDGPFSVHLDQKMPQALEGLQEVSRETALETARSILNLQVGQLSFSRETDGKIPAYSFIGHLNGGEIMVDITKTGGLPLSMMDTRTTIDKSMSVDDCIRKAEKFLLRCGYESMEVTYWYDTGAALLVNFAFTVNDTVIYTDLIKVGVARDTGEIVQFEAKGYLMNHIANRSVPDVAISADQAQKVLTPDLTFEGSKLCVIPSPGEYERLCYELTCLTEDGTRVLIYVSADTGLEENILVLIEDGNGTLAV